MGAVWRLLVDEPRAGALNMALDRAMLASHLAGLVPPTLRLYSWCPPAVSLGRFQDAADVDGIACARRGFDVVRRPTGGRGVLHDRELTYAIVTGTAEGVPRSTAASYRYLCSALAEAYRLLGVEAELTARRRGRPASGACYLHATPADLSLGAAKLSGSAQVWSSSSVLQHGSFVIDRDVAAEAEVFRLGAAAAEELGETTATLSGALGREPSRAEIVDAVSEAFRRVLGIEMGPGELSEGELEAAAVWMSEHEVEVAPAARPKRSG